MSEVRRKFDEDFKQGAVQLVIDFRGVTRGIEATNLVRL